MRDGLLTYRIYNGSYDSGQALGQVTLTFTQHDGQYQAQSRASASGLTALFYSGFIEQASSGRVTADGMQPQRYAERRGDRPERAVTVDLATSKVIFAEGSASAPPGLQDRLSSLLQLSLLARSQPQRFKPGQAVTLDEMSFSDIQRIAYRVNAYEVLLTPQGPLNAIHLTRERPDKPDEPTIEIWLGYEKAMLPIRLKVTDRNGRSLDQMIDSESLK